MATKAESTAARSRKRPAEVLTQKEMKRLIAAPSRRAPSGIRNRALLVVAYRGGLRCQEALDLMPADLDLEDGAVHVRHGKGDKSRRIWLDDGARLILAEWARVREGLGICSTSAFFSTLDGRPLQTAYVRGLMKRLARRAGIEKRVSFHGLRHTYASELAAEGIPVNQIQRLLGHSSLATTATYLAHVSAHDLAEAVARRPEWTDAPKPK